MTSCRATVWIKSSYSMQNGDCVETLQMGEGIAVRDSKRPGGPHLRLSAAAWTAFLGRLREQPPA